MCLTKNSRQRLYLSRIPKLFDFFITFHLSTLISPVSHPFRLAESKELQEELQERIANRSYTAIAHRQCPLYKRQTRKIVVLIYMVYHQNQSICLDRKDLQAHCNVRLYHKENQSFLWKRSHWMLLLQSKSLCLLESPQGTRGTRRRVSLCGVQYADIFKSTDRSS
ncbi:hypothetical protein Bca101_058951 [Brassica carinata]